eukprot:TRINITY_DN4248_c0_g3_i1.p1 TRINITY_DN4248_c0_g3~~TRINITY_DN4248_c0_g3_i1.p1  ORF type:complete len:300 (+),score=35.49 TRINITY_DN4248_c0_g3_i1:216-1115(+)
MEVKRRTARSLVQRLNSDSEQIRTQALCELRLLSKHDPDSRAYISEAGAIHLLLHLLYSTSPAAQENAIATLLNLSISDREPLMATPGLLDALAYLLRHPSSPASAQNASATLYSLLVVEDYRPIIGAKPQIVSALVDLLRSHSSPTRSIKDALKALFGIALYPLNRPRIVDLGAVPTLFSLALKDRSIGIMEDATAVIAQIAGCYESIDAFRKVSGVPVLADLLDPATGSTARVRENSVAALLNLIQSGGEKAMEDVREIGTAAIGGIADVAESGSSRAKSKASALLSILTANNGFSA